MERVCRELAGCGILQQGLHALVALKLVGGSPRASPTVDGAAEVRGLARATRKLLVAGDGCLHAGGECARALHPLRRVHIRIRVIRLEHCVVQPHGEPGAFLPPGALRLGARVRALVQHARVNRRKRVTRTVIRVEIPRLAILEREAELAAALPRHRVHARSNQHDRRETHAVRAHRRVVITVVAGCFRAANRIIHARTHHAVLVRLLRHRQTNTVILNGERPVLVELDAHTRCIPFKHLVKSVLDRLHDGLLLLTTHRFPVVLLDAERQRQTLQQVLAVGQDLQLFLTETAPLAASALLCRHQLTLPHSSDTTVASATRFLRTRLA